MPETRNRLDFLDVAKGLLILVVIYHHSWMQGYDSGQRVYLYTLQTYASWFMPAFFVITGYCSNFNKSFIPYIISNLRTLVWPAITSFLLVFLTRTILLYDASIFCDALKTIPLWGFNWFLSVLFLSKLIYWFTKRYIDFWVWRGLILLGLAFLAIWMNDKNIFGENWLHHRHALYLTLWLFVGEVMRFHNKLPIKFPFTVLFSWLIVTLLCMKVIGVLPGIAGVWINFGVDKIPLHILLSLLGTLMIISIAKWIDYSKFLQFVGRNSLVFYLFHNEFLRYAGKATITIFHPSTDLSVILACIFTMLLSLAGCSLLVRLFSMPGFNKIIRL